MVSKFIKLSGSIADREVHVDGKWLSPQYSQSIHNHSPDGFMWGYGGSGPAQLALAILLLYTDRDVAIKNYQIFKHEVIASLPQTDFDTEINIAPYIQHGEEE